MGWNLALKLFQYSIGDADPFHAIVCVEAAVTAAFNTPLEMLDSGGAVSAAVSMLSIAFNTPLEMRRLTMCRMCY